jgi:hypothetical protein
MAQLGGRPVLRGNREGSFVARETGSLFVFVDDADSSLSGSYTVVVDVNAAGSRGVTASSEAGAVR